MAFQQIGPIYSSRYGNTGTINVSRFSRTGSPYSDTSSFAILLQKTLINSTFNILFGDDQAEGDALFGSSSILGGAASSISDPFADITGGTTFPSDLGGQATYPNSVSPQLEMIARSNLLGKTVSATYNNKTVQGKVENVSTSNGILLFSINVNGTIVRVPPEKLLSVSAE